MAAEDEGRTEEPSEYKLEKARKEGRVPKSPEVSAALVLILSVVTLIFLGKWIFYQCLSLYQFYFERCGQYDLQDPALITFFLSTFLKIVIPIAIIAAAGGFFGNIVQTRGIVFSLKPISPKFSNIVPKFGEFFKKTIFSAKGLFNIAKSLGKVAVIVIIAYIFIKGDLFELLEIIKNGQIVVAIGRIATMAAQILLIVAFFFLVISIPDFFVQRHEFRESMKMTKQEVKEEYKEMEGDPEVKGRLKQMQQQLLSQNIPKAVSESDAPKVTAKGEDELAFTIRRIANENNIPIVEDKPVARGLYTETEVGDIIPETYYRTISIIYSHLKNYSK